MERDAKTVAQYVVNYYIEAEAPITNLKLQKILYLVWVAHYKKTGEYLFDDEFVASPLGPIIPSVYYEYCAYGADMIFRHVSVEIPWAEAYELDGYLVDYEWMSENDLIELATPKGGAWDTVYQGDKGRDNTIDFETIIKLDCQRKEKDSMFTYKKDSVANFDIEAVGKRDIEDELMAKANEAAILAHEYAIDVLKRAKELKRGETLPTLEVDLLPLILETMLINPMDVEHEDIGIEFRDGDCDCRDDDNDDDDEETPEDEEYAKAKEELREAFASLSKALENLKEALE